MNVDVATVRATPRFAVAPAVRSVLATNQRLDRSPPAADVRRRDWRAVALPVGFVVALTAVAPLVALLAAYAR